MGTLLGTAAILLLAGAFFPRITKILLPGGFEIDAAAVVNQITEELSTQLKARHPRVTPAEQSSVVARTAAASSLALQVTRRILADPKNYGMKQAELSKSDVDFVRVHGVLPHPVAQRVVAQALDTAGFLSSPS